MKNFIKKSIASIIVIVFAINIGYAQKDTMDIKPVFGVTARAGTFTYYGDLNTKSLPFTSDNKINYGVGLAFKWKALSASVNYDFIKFGQSLNTPSDHRNFEAKGSMFGVDVNFWPIIKKNYGLFIGTGLSYVNYAIHTDTIDANGISYKYWSDGSIRNQTESYNSAFTSVKTKRDYNFESSLGNQAYMLYPVRAGVMLRFIKDIQMSYSAGFYFTNKKGADGFNTGVKKNYFMYNTVSLTWYFNSYDEVNQGVYKDINFKDIWDSDEDKDGVSDNKDKCLGTPKGIKVTSSGCALDSDGDGIPDYKDKEIHTPKNKLPDLNGVGQEPGTGIVPEDTNLDTEVKPE